MNPWVKGALIVGALLAPGVKADVPRETIAEETLFQAVHLIDTAQTLGISHTPCHWDHRGQECPAEAFAGALIGHHPSDRSVWALMGTEAVLHLAVTAGLYRAGAPMWVQRGWQAVTIGFQLADDDRNVRIGLRLRF